MRRTALLALITFAAFLAGAGVERLLAPDPGSQIALTILKGAAFSGED